MRWIPLPPFSGYRHGWWATLRIERDAPDAIASQHAPGAGGTPGWATWVPIAAGAYALLTALSTLIGWAADVPRLTDWKNDGISMFPNTATAAAASGRPSSCSTWEAAWRCGWRSACSAASSQRSAA